MTEINNSTNSFLDELLEAAPDDLYIKEIARTFETEQMARLSQSLFKTYALTGMLFEKIKRSSLLTKLTQVYQSTPTTKDKRVALGYWNQVFVDGWFYSAGIANSIHSEIKEKRGLSDSELDLCNRYHNEKRRIASSYREIGGVFAVLREAMNQRSHISSLSIGGGLILTAAPVKIIEVTERILLLTDELVSHKLFQEDDYAKDGEDLKSSIEECRCALVEFKSNLDAADLKALFLKGIKLEIGLPVPEQSIEGYSKISIPENESITSAEIKAHFGNLVMLISKNILLLQDEVRSSSLQIAEVIDRTSEKSLGLLKSELGAATTHIATKLESGSSKANASENPFFEARTSTRLTSSRTDRMISQQEASARLESLKHEITKEAKRQFASRGKSVEYYHCIVNKTMYEAYMYNRITDIRSNEAKGFIDRLIASRNPRHNDVIAWQVENYADEINQILSCVAYPLYEDESDDEVPF